MADPILVVTDLQKRFAALRVTANVNLSVRPHTIHALIGPNGAGKTTLMHQIAGTLRPDAGSVHLDGADITRLPPHRRARSGLARSFQVSAILPDFSCLENVALAVQAQAPRLTLSPAATDERLNAPARAALARVGLNQHAQTLAARLSHGDQRKLELAVALAARPRLLLLDEPLAGAGPEETQTLVALLAGLRAECAILLVEHDMTAVFALADDITVLAAGAVIAQGPPATVRADPAVRAAYLGDS